ncbi:hypothetical protein BD289DRAFT_77163 [Coniella lustricola]|uniref:leucine--tRNA ligase n=1 Tax=Coniella lustricola TaxID=2025994 RepID=A0A2T2ZZC7_9PEZI|nr:hypothetical protein BD289DRAFT_77163 [Coniella lustricola]
MNGTLHVGHAFSDSKVEFMVGYERMQGKRVLWPQGYHCTGLPIKASADKIAKEIKLFGQEFENYKEDEEVAVEQPAGGAKPVQVKSEDVTKFKATKGKANAKTIKMKYQFQIMEAVGIPRNEIHRFADAHYWLEFFPPLCKRDLSALGCRIDWRRQFVTTDANPYYDAFVRWQMTRLREMNKIKFGKRYTIYSIKDGQPCMDHDRSDGEGVGPQEYTALKLKVLEWSAKAAEAVKGKLPEGANIFFVPATLRPETMYGQTACYVGPKLTYGIYQASENDYYVIGDRAARNMAFQGLLKDNGAAPKSLVDIQGSDCIGTLVNAPLSLHANGIRILPMDTVLETKGTGVVTSVPSDSPDDYATVRELAKKADYYGIQKEWAELEIFPIISTPTYGDICAKTLVEQLKIASPKDTKPLAEAKELAYKEGFYQGTILVGKYKGEKVETAKPKVRADLIAAGEAFPYAEPEGQVVSRSGDKCIVALMDQWYLDYGEAKWRDQAIDWVQTGLNTYSNETKNAFIGVLNWLNQWACARTYGLGSKLPFDTNFLVESLSDSTIYMAYYTLVPWLHTDLFGRAKGKGDISAEQMIDEVWDYVFCRRELSDEILEKSKISKATLEGMRRDFEYWYPLDVRVSGKDLIPNHLTFFLYNHIAFFSQEYWPQGIRANGHLMLNGAKMSKSTGNFMTLDDTVKKYGADAARIALADAGDGNTDANFEEDVADNGVLRLFNNREWIEEVSKDTELRTGPLNSYQDALFDNEMNVLVAEAKKEYTETNYKLALKAAWFDFTSARDFYREACAGAGIKMHKDLIFRYFELQALVLVVIAPHWCEWIWLEILKKPQSIQLAQWPEVPAANLGLSAARDYVRQTSSNVNSAEAAQLKKKAKGKETAYDPKKPKMLTIFTSDKYPAWQEKYIELLREHWDTTSKSLANDKDFNDKIKKGGEAKKAMPFVKQLQKRLEAGEDASVVLERKLGFDEQKTLLEMVSGLKRTTGFTKIVVVHVIEGTKKGKDLTDGGKEIDITSPLGDNAVPGAPSYLFENYEA